MNFRHGNMMQLQPFTATASIYCNHLLLFTANGVITSNNKLVMGAGIAKTIRDYAPGIDRRLAHKISNYRSGLYSYGLAIDDKTNIGAFQSKLDWRHPSTLSIIKQSVTKLLDYCKENPNTPVHLNFPGIGFGGLTPEQVLPVLQPLPDQVTIWQYRR